MLTNQTSYIGFLLFWRGPENFEYTTIFKQLISTCRTFLDIGANSGYYSILAGKISGNVLIHAFEPASGPYHFLQENIRLNGLSSRVTAHALALSDKKAVLTFSEAKNPKYHFVKHNLGGMGRLTITDDKPEHKTIKVSTVSLDEFCAPFSESYIDLIKMDTEGTENFILEGAKKTIALHKPIIICETLYNKIEKQLEEIMKRHGYNFFHYRAGKLHPASTLQRENDNGIRDCFFVHPDKIHLIKKFIA